ncbi:MAG: hypothetical protein RI925_104 [Pseudomonadota bacterium]
MKRLQLRIELREDLHIGTGAGWGDIDARHVRDRHGRPILPASHIKGVLRAHANEWLRLEPTALTRERIERLFGRSGKGQGGLQFTSAYLSADTEKPTIRWGSTQIGPTGTAQEESLRFVECAPAGSCFVMEAMLPEQNDTHTTNDQNSAQTDHDTSLSDEDLLKAILARCHRLGGGRNRGHGLVRWQWSEHGQHDARTWRAPPERPARLRLLLRNLDPVCLARTGHPGNLISSETFIRGRSLRGAVVATCLAMKHAEWAHALLADTLSWGDALPLPEPELDTNALAHIEVLPIPLSIGAPKTCAANTSLPWWAQPDSGNHLGARQEYDQMNPEADKRPPGKLKRPKEGEYLFRPHPEAPWQRYAPQVIERLHTRTPSDENAHEQALFSTEEIAERTLFVADLLVSSPAQAAVLADALSALNKQWLRMGRGGRPLVIEQIHWLPAIPHAAATEDNFTLLLESDLIARDDLGNFHQRLTAQVVAELAGLPDSALSETQAFSESHDIFGFNAATGLPRQAQRAIKAGSVIRITGPDAPKVCAALSRRQVLGECPEEGFGRFRLDKLPAPSPLASAPRQASAPAPGRTEQLCQTAYRWQQKFGAAQVHPSASQWGDFRGHVRAVSHAEALAKVFETLQQAADKQGGHAWKAFVDHPCYRRFYDEIFAMPLSDAQALLDYFVRWQSAMPSSKPEDNCQ